jgi:TPR repeat protein
MGLIQSILLLVTVASQQPVEADQCSLEDVQELNIPANIVLKAQTGNADSQFAIAAEYASKSFDDWRYKKRAACWLTAAAENGSVDAQNEMGYAHERGDYGLKQDINLAIKWYEMAANSNEAYAHYNLFRLYRYGQGVEWNDEVALDHLKASAELGYSISAFEYGLRLHSGIGTDIDKVKGQAYIDRSISQGFDLISYFSEVVEFLGQCIFKKIHHQGETWASAIKAIVVDLEKTPLLASSETDCGELSTISTSQRSRKAQGTPGISFTRQQNLIMDASTIFALRRMLSLLDDRDSQRKLSIYYHDGYGTQKSAKQSKLWAQKAKYLAMRERYRP